MTIIRLIKNLHWILRKLVNLGDWDSIVSYEKKKKERKKKNLTLEKSVKFSFSSSNCKRLFP